MSQKEYIYYEDYFTDEFRKAFFEAIVFTMVNNHLEENDGDFEMFLIMLLTDYPEIGNVKTSDIVNYYKEDLRKIYYAYFKVGVSMYLSKNTVNDILSKMQEAIRTYDLAPSDVDFRNCTDIVLEDLPEDERRAYEDILLAKRAYFEQSFYNLVYINHNMKGENRALEEKSHNMNFEDRRRQKIMAMHDDEFIRHFCVEFIVDTSLTAYAWSETAEEWAEWCTQEYGEHYYNRSFYNLAADHKYYIEECLTNTVNIIRNLL
jgi:hypothetical protein